MEDLEKALEFANYQSTLKQQKDILKQKFKDDCIYAYNGGLFSPNIEWLSAIYNIKEENQWVIDINGNPIWIENIKEFHRLAYENFMSAIAKFGETHSDIKKQRSVKSLVGL
jgi:hypothetical protein